MDQPASITCPRCSKRSFHPQDIENRYCGFCKLWHDDWKAAVKCTLCDGNGQRWIAWPPGARPELRVCADCNGTGERTPAEALGPASLL